MKSPLETLGTSGQDVLEDYSPSLENREHLELAKIRFWPQAICLCAEVLVEKDIDANLLKKATVEKLTTVPFCFL